MIDLYLNLPNSSSNNVNASASAREKGRENETEPIESGNRLSRMRLVHQLLLPNR